MLYSFDVFDTLITRRVATPDGIFAVMQQRLRCDERYSAIPEHVINNFFLLRKKAENQTRRLYYTEENREITLDQIYKTICMTGSLDDEHAQMILRLEIQTELDNVVGINNRIDQLFNLYNNGERVVLISDMYLSEDIVREMLVSADERFKGITIYVSSAYLKNKHSGTLYEVVREKEQISFNDWTHYGDNSISDVAIPEKLGIRTSVCEGKVLLPIERDCIKTYGYDADVQYLIGASANARLLSDYENANNRKAFSYGTSVISPIVIDYISWVLSESIQKGIKNLFFVARDGYLLKKAADAMILQKEYDIHTHYIFGSRKAWRVASFDDDNWNMEEFFKWTGSNDASICDISAMFGIQYEDIIQYLPAEYCKSDGIVSAHDRARIAKSLCKDDNFKALILAKARKERDIIKQYLSENICIVNRDYAFVELIGSGYTQRGLSRILKEMTDYPTKSFFYRLDADFGDKYCKYYCYCPGILEKKLIEPMFSAPHGSTEGYRIEKNGKVVPIFAEEDKAFSSYGMDDFQRGFCCFLDHYDLTKSTTLIIEEYFIQYLIGGRDKELLDFIGDIPFSDSGREKQIQRYAPILSVDDIEVLFGIRLLEPLSVFYKGADLEYSIRRCNDFNQELIRRAKKESDTIDGHKKRIEYWKNSAINWAKAAGCDWVNELDGDKIAVYGAGKAGKMLTGSVGLDGVKEVTLWVDKRYEALQEEGWNIHSTDELYRAKYDYLIIAIIDKRQAYNVKNELVQRGIDESKVLLMR